MTTYSDPRIECDDAGISIHAYYFPWGTKHIRYDALRSLERFSLKSLGGNLRIWGSGDLRHWTNLDTGRPRKEVGFRLDIGARIVPWVTPDRPDAFEAAVREHAHLPPADGQT
jgi:hypothetical protein